MEFTEPQKNVIPGQAIVFYAGDEVLGGGFAEVIEKCNCPNPTSSKLWL